MLEATAEALVMLNAFREREGAATAREMRQRCENIRGLVARMEKIRAGAIPAFQKRLRDKLADLLAWSRHRPPAPGAGSGGAGRPQRYRRRTGPPAHPLRQLETMLKAGGEVGKRLDFLLQEMNREANTVLSKTGGLGDLGLTITDLALAAKSEIDKIREQSFEPGITDETFFRRRDAETRR